MDTENDRDRQGEIKCVCVSTDVCVCPSTIESRITLEICTIESHIC